MVYSLHRKIWERTLYNRWALLLSKKHVIVSLTSEIQISSYTACMWDNYKLVVIALHMCKIILSKKSLLN